MVFRKREIEKEEEYDEVEQTPEVPRPTSMQKPQHLEDKHKAGDVEPVQIDLGNGTFKVVMRVYANEKESAMSEDPLQVLMAKHLFIALANQE